MVSKKVSSLSSTLLLLLLLAGFANSDIEQDKAECTNKLIALANCLPYVGGQAKTPTIDCCTGIKEVVDKSKRCLCILIKDHDDPNLGIQINVPLALKLPGACKIPTNLTQCVDILHLTPKSQEAKVFEGFDKAAKQNSSTPVPSASETTANTTNGTSTKDKSNGGWGKRWLVVELLCVIFPFVFISHFLLSY